MRRATTPRSQAADGALKVERWRRCGALLDPSALLATTWTMNAKAWQRFAIPGRLRHRCRQHLRRLSLEPNSCTVEAILAAVTERTGRPIHVVEISMSKASGCGLWVAVATRDYICVDASSRPLLRRHTLLHELGHIVFDHRGLPDFAAMAAGLDTLDPEMVRRVLGRTDFRDGAEREAETFADIAAEWCDRLDHRPRQAWP